MSDPQDDEPDEFADGTEVNPKDLKDARPWLKLIEDAKRAFEDYNARCDNIDKLYANLERLGNIARDRQMALFWANMSVLAPSIYARPPVPVVTPRFKDRKPLLRTASELLERSAIVGFEVVDLDSTLRLVRDDLARLGRGVVWQRYETKDGRTPQKVCDDYKHRKDFLHDPARIWAEVDWVAAAAYLTRSEMRKRFKKPSGDVYKDAAYEVRKDENNDHHDSRLKAQVWEIWSKSGGKSGKVIWVAEGCEKCLEIAEPHLELDGFFPCPRPAYGTLQPNSLIPVPDVMQYRDQLEEINELTARISALTDAIKLRAFYPAGMGEVGDAIEAAIKSTDDNVVMVGVSNWAMLGNGNPNDMLVWLPIEKVAETIAQLIDLRRQVIQDVYEISGISDILRGQTDPNETLGAQELKAQTGSTRIRDKQQEMVRLARDVTRISAEIMAENFSSKTLLEMSQMEIPTNADVAKQIKGLEAQGKEIKDGVAEAMSDPAIQQQAQQNPDMAKKAMAQFEEQAKGLLAQIDKLKQTITIEQVMTLLRDQRIRPYVLDIETDSTIAPDENAQKQRATEYITAMTGLFQQAIPAVQQVPQSAPLLANMIKFANSQFRVGREFEGDVEEFTEQMKAMASAPKNEGPNPDQIKAQAEAGALQAKTQIEAQRSQADAAKAQAEAQETAANAERVKVENAERMQALGAKQATDDQERAKKAQEANDAAIGRAADIEGKKTLAAIQQQAATEARIAAAQKHLQDMETGRLNIELLETKIEQAKTATDNSVIATQAGVEAKKAAAAQKPAPSSD